MFIKNGIAPRWFTRSLLVFVFALLVVALIRWQATLSYLGSYLICSQAPQSADLILVLGGDFYGPRVFKGVELKKLGYAPTVLISSPPYRGRPEGEFAIAFLAEHGYPTDAIETFVHNARSTTEEAIALRGELARRGVKRVILVTAAFHSRRAAIVFWLFCPGIHFISVPAPDPFYHSNGWWRDETSRRLFYSEWAKIFGSALAEYPKYLLSKF